MDQKANVHYSAKQSSAEYLEGQEFFFSLNELYIDDNKVGIIDHKLIEPFLDWKTG